MREAVSGSLVTYQRRHGLPITIWKTKFETDNRGNKREVPDPTDTHQLTAWVFPQRSARAEVPGQLVIDVVRIGTQADLSNVSLWSRVEMQGRQWDVVTPPAYHHGTRHTRHWSLELRARP